MKKHVLWVLFFRPKIAWTHPMKIPTEIPTGARIFHPCRTQYLDAGKTVCPTRKTVCPPVPEAGVPAQLLAGTTVIWVLQKWTHGFSEKNPASNRASTRKTVRPPKSETVFSWERSQLNVQYYSLVPAGSRRDKAVILNF